MLVLALCWLGLLLSPGTKAAEDDHMPHDNNQTTDGVQSLCQALDPSPQVQPFVEELTQPPVIDISTGQQLTLGVYKIKQVCSSSPAQSIPFYCIHGCRH